MKYLHLIQSGSARLVTRQLKSAENQTISAQWRLKSVEEVAGGATPANAERFGNAMRSHDTAVLCGGCTAIIECQPALSACCDGFATVSFIAD